MSNEVMKLKLKLKSSKGSKKTRKADLKEIAILSQDIYEYVKEGELDSERVCKAMRRIAAGDLVSPGEILDESINGGILYS